ERPYRSRIQAEDVSASSVYHQDSPAPPLPEGGSATATDDKSSDCGCSGGDSNNCDCCKHKHEPFIKIDECDPLKCEDQETCRLFDECCYLKENGWTLTGWIDGGIMANGN